MIKIIMIYMIKMFTMIDDKVDQDDIGQSGAILGNLGQSWAILSDL